MTDVDQMTPAELDAAVAEEVVGLHGMLHQGSEDGSLRFLLREGDNVQGREFSPATDVSADYEVLKMARKWPSNKQFRFGGLLRRVWHERLVGTCVHDLDIAILYEPGDYARAALKAVRQDRKP